MAKIILSAPNFNVYDSDGFDLVARTGSVSIELLNKAEAQGVILGHSEVGDEPITINAKFKTLIARRKLLGNDLLRLSTILIGEPWEEYNGLSLEEVAGNILKRTKIILEDIDGDSIRDLCIGYEPKWGTRGSGKEGVEPATYDLVDICNKTIRKFIFDTYGEEVANSINYIFGGMTTPERAENLTRLDNCDGLILGSASNTVKKFLDIAEAMKKGSAEKLKVIHVNMKVFNREDGDEAYIDAFRSLDDTFLAYVSPPLTDIYKYSLLIK
jgi:triosephosphate isomerase